jgi:Zn-dependent peptidase ImmA (M78 family)/DNA-binding XRE family transcriptional regulator
MISGERIRQAREFQGLTQAELAEKAGVEQPFLSLLEQNARQPSQEVLSRIALATRFPEAFFKLPPGPDFPLGSLLYRSKRKVSSSENSIVRQHARVVLELVTVLEARFKPLPVRIPLHNDCEVTEAASLARSALGYSPDGPIVGLMSRLEKAGVLIYAVPVAVDTPEAFSAWAAPNDRRPVIVLTRAMPGDRQRFTLGHELGHLVMHQSFLGGRDLEDEANAFSTEFLIPENDAREELSLEPLTLTRLAKIKSRWGVSMEALLYRAEALEVISTRQHSYLRSKMRSHGFLGSEPVPITPEKPRYLRQILESALGNSLDLRNLSGKFPISSRFVEELLAANGTVVEQVPPVAESGKPSVLKFPARP